MKVCLRRLVCLLLIFGVSCIQFPTLAASAEEVLTEEELGDEGIEEGDVIVEEIFIDDEGAPEGAEEVYIEEAGEPADNVQQDDEYDIIVEDVAVDEAPAVEDVATQETAPAEAPAAAEITVVEEPVFDAPVQTAPVKEVSIQPGEFYEYTIVKGDCLWFISDRFYKDPFLWPEIHKANPYIADPHWIYPDDKLIIPGIAAQKSEPAVAAVDRTYEQAPAVAPVEEVIEDVVEAVPSEEGFEEEVFEDVVEAEPIEEEMVEEQVVDEVVQADVSDQNEAVLSDENKYISSSFVAPLDWQFDGYVIGEETQKLMVSQGDDIYIDLGSDAGLRPETRCIVYRAGRKIRDQVSKKVLGRVVRKIAVVEAGHDIEAEVSTARVITSYDYIKPGDMIRIVKK